MGARNTNNINPSGYLGVNAPNPPNLIRVNRAPTQNDYTGILIGTLWVDTTVNPPSPFSVYILMSKERQVATWVNFGAAVPINEVEFTADEGTNPVIPDADSNVNLHGGELINTVGGLNTVTFNLNRGDNGQVPIAATGAATVYANIISANTNLSVTNGANSITLTVPNAELGDLTLTGNTGGPIAPVANNINTIGSGLITIAGTGNTLTTQLTEGMDGQLPIAATGNPTIYANLTSGDASIAITNGPNTIDLTQASGGIGTITITTFDASGTWTKADGTIMVEVIGWNGGGGGGSGQRGGLIGGGAGGSWGTVGWYRFPQAFVSSSVPIIVGSGGVGGAAITTNDTRGNNGSESGVSKFGNIVFSKVKQGTSADGSSGGAGGFGSNTPIAGGYPQLWLGTEQPYANVLALADATRGGSGTFTVGGDAGNAGWPLMGFHNWSLASNYLQGTGGGGGGGGALANSGGSGGTVITTDGLTIVNAGGAGGVGAGGAGSVGNNGATGATSSGIMTGGTGGGGGASGGGVGGQGGFPGGGGGGGGGSANGTNSGSGGTGGAGRVIVIEYS